MKTLRPYSFLLFALLGLLGQAQEQTAYVLHSSGMALGRNSEGRAVLLPPEEAQPLRLRPLADGAYNIVLEQEGTTGYLSVGTANAWSTYFEGDPSTPRAQYTLSAHGTHYVLLTNRHTGGLLGTDHTSAGAYVYSDKRGTGANNLWRLAASPFEPLPADTVAWPLSTLALRQRWEGWGVSLCWWANLCGRWSDEAVDRLVDWMVSPEGLNWNLFRYNIGGGDDPANTHCTPHHMAQGKGLRAEMEGFLDGPDAAYNWERDAAQRRILLKIRERRPDAVFEAFSNSAPWWMTHSGCCAGAVNPGQDNLKPEHYETFARYLVDVCKHYKEAYGIEFRTLEPFNEPQTNYWGANGGQEGCHFDLQSQSAFLRVLSPILARSGLSTRLATSDETNLAQSIAAFRHYGTSGVLPLVGQWNSHTYSATDRQRSQIGSLARQAGLTQWQSETGSGGTGLQGNLNMAQRLMDDLRYMLPDAWLDWQYVEESNDQWCLVQTSFADESSARRVKNYYVRQQFTRFFPAGCRFVATPNAQSLAALNPTRDTLTLALLNGGAGETIHRIALPFARIAGEPEAWRTSEGENLQPVSPCLLRSDSVLEASLPAQSLTTLRIPLTLWGEEHQPASGDVCLLVPQSNAGLALAASESGVKALPLDADSPAQRWTLGGQPGAWTLTNALGERITWNTGYALRAQQSEAAGQTFLLESVSAGDYFWKIMDPSGQKAFDLAGASPTAGTVVGMYAYGTSPAADTRHFALVPLALAPSTTPDGVEQPSARAATPAAIFNLQGQTLPRLQRGINLLRQPDGTVRKVIW